MQSPEIIFEQAAEEDRESREEQLSGGQLQTLSLMVSFVSFHEPHEGLFTRNLTS